MLDDADILSDLDQLRSRYEVLRHLGFDGGCAVYAVRGRDSSRHYLVKVMRKPGSGSAQAGTLHLWQADAMARLDHPNLIALHTVNHFQGGTLALAMERRKGPTLAERIDAGGALEPAEVEGILRDVAQALDYLHRRGVVHRGVNPDSIIIDPDGGQARLAHFGIPPGGRAGEAGMDESASLDRVLAYASPEQAGSRVPGRGREPGPQSDLFSLGLVGYALLTGGALRGDGTAPAAGPETLPPLETVRPDAPPYLRHAIEGCLRTDPRRRWASAEAFLSQLDPAAIQPVAPRGDAWNTGGMSVALAELGASLSVRAAATRGRPLALALPALLALLAWAAWPENGSAPAERAGRPAIDAGTGHEVSRTLPADGHPLEEATPALVSADLRTPGSGTSPDLEWRPAEPVASGPSAPAAARGPGRAAPKALSRPAPKGPALLGVPAARRSVPPLLGEELASADRGR